MARQFPITPEYVSILILLLAAMFIAILLAVPDIEAEVGGPIAGMTSPTGWVVENGDETSYSDETILLNGDLIIQSGGSLSFDTVDMYSNARGDKNATIRILVEEGGTFTIRDSLLSSRYEVDQYQGNQPWRYKFHVEGTLAMTDTTVEYMWGDLEGILIPDQGGTMHSTNQGGIEIWSDDVFIQDCIIARGQTSGMNIREGSPVVLDTDFIENDGEGLSVFDGESSGVFRGCTFSNNGGRGVTLHANYLDFNDNVIQDNGGAGFFIINSMNVSFDNLEVSGNLWGLHVVLCDATFTNSTIVDNQVTMAVTNEGSVVLLNCVCDITGDDLDLHEGCWVADCVPVEVTVKGGGDPLDGAKVRLEGRNGNLTWTGYARTDSDGMVILPAALMVRNGEWWYNLSDFEVEVTYNGKRSNRTETIDGPETLTFDLGSVGGDGGSGGDGDDDPGDGEPSDVKDGGNDEKDLNDYLPVIGVVAVIAFVAVVLVSRWNRNREQSEDDEWDDEGYPDDADWEL
jgi:hypothetical protein